MIKVAYLCSESLICMTNRYTKAEHDYSMAFATSILENVRQLAKKKNIHDLDCHNDDLAVEKIRTHHLCDVYRVTNLKRELTYSVKTKKPNASPTAAESYFIKEDYAVRFVNGIFEGLLPRILAIDLKCFTAIEEDLTGYESLWHRIIYQSRVDHGITCRISQLLARLHRDTSLHRMNDVRRDEVQKIFGTETPTESFVDQVFITLTQAECLTPELDEKVKAVAEGMLHQAQFVSGVNAVREIYNNKKECVIHGNINMTNIIVKDQQCIKMTEFGFAQLGPGTYDLASLIASYMTAYYKHLLTEEDNSRHRQTAYCMLDCVNKTIDTYLEERTSLSPWDEQDKRRFIHEVTAFTGVQLVRRALDTRDWSDGRLPPNVCVSILQSGYRLLNKYSTIDNAGRLLLIGLQLC